MRGRKGRVLCGEQVWLRPQEKAASQREAAGPGAGMAEGEARREALPLKVASIPARVSKGKGEAQQDGRKGETVRTGTQRLSQNCVECLLRTPSRGL